LALLALEEKGYGDDEIDRRIVDLGKGENFDPTFLRLSPKATVPILVVPLQRTLTDDVESRYKAVTETKSIVQFLDTSRSAMSRTHTTSAAPAPALTPATIAFATKCKTIIDDILHSEAGNPNNLRYLNARDENSLEILADQILPVFTEKQKALTQYLSDAANEKIHVSDKVKTLWSEKKDATEVFLEVFQDAKKPKDQLEPKAQEKRANYFAIARDAWEVVLKDILVKLSHEVVGPYALGDQFSIADLHLAGWMARLVSLAGGVASDDGITAIGKLEAHIGNGFTLPKGFQVVEVQHNDRSTNQSKLTVFWDAMRSRASWKKVYGAGLY